MCDECKYYCWYYDHCEKWDCKVDEKSTHNCFEKRDTPVLNIMIGR